MFVSTNDFKAIRQYFAEGLGDLYTSGERKIILKYLFMQRFNASAADYLLADDKLLSESDLLFFRSAFKRLQKNEPFQYVIGETEFYGLSIHCDERALIPRPETEELVDWILSEHQSLSAVLDVCSGTGCIALAIKANQTNANVYALEYSEVAVDLLEKNERSNELVLSVIQADAIDADYLEETGEKLDVIVSNPPYIPNRDRSKMAANVLDFEPGMALFVEDDDPLIFYREILKRSRGALNEKGWVYFEIHEDLGSEMKSLFEQMNFVNIELRKDLQGRDRMMRGQVVTCAHEREGSQGNN